MSEVSCSDNRRRQPKSKTGCRICKKRRVKCDETRPSCRNCLKYGAQCDYVTIKVRVSLSPTPSKTSCLDGLEDVFSIDDGFSIDDLELFHHYHTSTCLTFTTEPHVRSFWQLAAPPIGFSNQYVLRSMLAITALHLSRFKKEREGFFLARAFMHHRAALAMAEPLLVDMTAENCEQLFLFNMLEKFFAFARPKDDSDLLLVNTHERSSSEWLIRFRSVHKLAGQKKQSERLSFIGTLLQDRSHLPLDFWLAYSSEKDALDELEAKIYTSTTKDLDALTAVLDALHHLQQTFVVFNESTFSGESPVRGVLWWLRTISDAYIALLAEGDNEALCVLSFYCILLRRLEHVWWVEGWGLHLIERIYRELPDKFRLWIRWPIQEIGWVP
ncbi:hypothetical protein PFICI_00186 [Pestalotiopsis fici W106-1]|uniref:Zn(2)-C6 fungal-type domain-containing protein n=1 Tax=Pestalotiopsis fici (strain W106-1 / CGMCC3.15140) TaxID=1229662 RepID=W3XJZ3_PESFW|nr:uncharacterized protein PFICI_00186 [Pestalotiopsis fici W106-1]ETS86358.1 hypothetical protein PFICI_00186 [Pestalotiopsis fici W106-1]